MDDMLEVDVSISEDNTKFGILGSDRTLAHSLESVLIVGQTIEEQVLSKK